MATITLYKDKLNGVGSLIDTMVSSVNNLDMQLGALKATLQGVNSSTYNLDSAVENIRSSSQTEKEKADDLNKLSKEVDNFITVTVNRDQAAKEEINKAKEDFYTKYSYLKPECEKDFIEKVVDTVESAADWCCKHWKLIVTIVIVVVAVALLWTGVGGVLLAGACWGALSGAVIGGVSGGLTSMANGGSFLEGFEDGAFSGALAGSICGAAFAGLGQLGAVCGKSIKCISSFGKAIRGTAAVTNAISIAMGSFDALALADLAFGSGTIYDLNSKLHSNTAYNIFQTGVTALAVFTGGMTGTMKCFIAGTLIAIETGFAGIESIKPGDVVLSTNADTMETGYKKVLENIWSNRNIKAPGNNPLFTRHAEEVVANNFDMKITNEGLNPKDVSGTLKIHQSNPTGVCRKCIQGLANDNVAPGVLKQLSLKYPSLTIQVSSECVPGVKVTGRSNFVIRNGKYIE